MQYTIIRKPKRKTASVSVAPDNSVTVVVPEQLAETEIAKIIRRKRQWGSCYQDQSIVLNWRVIMAPVSIVDYVVAHGLCHLIYHDHSHKFWNLLQKVMPDYQQRKDYLRINDPYLEI